MEYTPEDAGPSYGFGSTRNRGWTGPGRAPEGAKDPTIKPSMVENAGLSPAMNIRKTQKKGQCA